MTNYQQSAQGQRTYALHAIYTQGLSGPLKEDKLYRRFVAERGYSWNHYSDGNNGARRSQKKMLLQAIGLNLSLQKQVLGRGLHQYLF